MVENVDYFQKIVVCGCPALPNDILESGATIRTSGLIAHRCVFPVFNGGGQSNEKHHLGVKTKGID